MYIGCRRWPERLREFMGEPMDVNRPGLVHFKNSKHVTMEGIILMDAPMWTTTFTNCDDVHVKNTKTVCYVINSDGINLVSCRNAIVEDTAVGRDDCAGSSRTIRLAPGRSVKPPQARGWPHQKVFGNAIA